MNASLPQRGIQAKTGQSTPRILVTLAIFAAVLSTAWLVIGRDILEPSTAERYRGLVRLAPDHEGQCAQFEFDNKTGLMWPKGATPCGSDITTSVPARSEGAGTMGRLNGISDYFKSR